MAIQKVIFHYKNSQQLFLYLPPHTPPSKATVAKHMSDCNMYHVLDLTMAMGQVMSA